MSEVSLDFLARRAQKGDAHACAQLVTHLSRHVTGCAFGYYTLVGEYTDLIQEGYVGLLAAIDKWNPHRGVPFSNFADLCIERMIQTAVLKGRRGKNQILNEAERMAPLLDEHTGEWLLSVDPADPFTVEDIAEARERLDGVLHAIHDNLSDVERECLTGHVAGLTYNQIREITGRSDKTVDNAIQRARRKLREVA